MDISILTYIFDISKKQYAMEKVITSNTYKLFDKLLEAGFNVVLTSAFQYAYDKDNNYLSITVRGCEDRLNELYGLSNGFDILVVKYADENKVSFEIRKPHDFAEFITESEWREYYNSTITA